jgi:carbamate kinase
VFYEKGMERPVATIITFARVKPDDPAFEKPTKPIGPHYDEAQAKRLAEERGWVVAAEAEGKWRPPVIRQLAESGAIVIAGGGGGVPVIEEGPRLVGVEAVVDKDLAGAILARDVEAQTFLICTDVEGVYEAYGTPEQKLLDRLSAADAKRMVADGSLPAGSMGPKVQAAIEFLEHGGERAIVCSLDDAPKALEGNAGTAITP